MEEASRFVASGAIKNEIVRDVPDIYIEATLSSDKREATVVISGRHGNVVEIRVNGIVVLKKTQGQTSSG